MNYPVWQLEWAGGGLLIAVVSVVHLYIAQFAVGGGLFLVLTEKLALARNDRQMLNYLERHARFFLLLTMVAGAVTGVGIWFTVSVLAPGATSILIHNFVFAWAAEWVCFLVEIVAIFVYYYRLRQMSPSDHLTVGWIYFAAAWLSLFLINAIVAFMLTPGKWLTSGNFWAAFFNPSMLASAAFRTALSISLAGIYGLLTALWIKEDKTRQRLLRYTAAWLLVPLAALAAASIWYLESLPGGRSRLLLARWPEVLAAGRWFIFWAALVTCGGLVLLARLPKRLQQLTVIVILATGLGWTGAFEWMREAARRPYLISGLMFSNGLTGPQAAVANQEGFAANARWFGPPANDELETGRRIFQFQCSACHSIGGPLNDIRTKTSKFSLFGMQAQLRGQGRINAYMPPFAGTDSERDALARYLVEEVNGRREKQGPEPVKAASALAAEPAPFDPQKDPFVLLAWQDSSACGSLYDPRFKSLQPRPVRVRAQLIRRGQAPEIVTGAVELTFRVGRGPSGPMKPDQQEMTFVTDSLPLVPYATEKARSSSTVVTIVATDKKTGRQLAATTVVVERPLAMGCRLCHGGQNQTGQTAADPATGNDIVEVHDRMNHTDLAKQLAKGKLLDCRQCHAEGKNKGRAMALSAAVHGLHANYLTGLGAEACNSCHGGTPEAGAAVLQGIHSQVGMDCTSCHGSIQAHALGLLRGQQSMDRPGTDRLMAHLGPADGISPRKPWSQVPDCLHCHQDFQEPETDQHAPSSWGQSFGRRSDDTGLMCAACHNRAHVLYPAARAAADMVALQYQKAPYPIGSNKNCAVCHTTAMEDEVHHPNMLTMFRNQIEIQAPGR